MASRALVQALVLMVLHSFLVVGDTTALTTTTPSPTTATATTDVGDISDLGDVTTDTAATTTAVDTPIPISNIALQQGAKAVELELHFKRDVICSANLLQELSVAMVSAVHRTSSDLFRFYCSFVSSAQVQILSTLQPVQGLRTQDEVVLEVLRQYKLPVSEFRLNTSSFIDFSFPVTVQDVYSCSSDPSPLPFEPMCGDMFSSTTDKQRDKHTWLGLAPFAPVSYVILIGASLLVCILLFIIALCVRRKCAPASQQKVDVLTWKANDEKGKSKSKAKHISSPTLVTSTVPGIMNTPHTKITSPTDKKSLRVPPSIVIIPSPTEEKKRRDKEEKTPLPSSRRPKKTTLQKPLLDPLTPPTPLASSPLPVVSPFTPSSRVDKKKSRKKIPETIFLTHTPLPTTSSATSTPNYHHNPSPTTFHFHPDRNERSPLSPSPLQQREVQPQQQPQPELKQSTRPNRTPDFPPSTQPLRKTITLIPRRKLHEHDEPFYPPIDFDLGQPLEYEPKPTYPTPAWRL